ncbi:hypothetical protein OIDMADRAFT_61188 [Oidiodendron maius Zn]|uniref:Coenzyme Q-binding protein COQ10 START domain-containing protein n=1 Tax=Oidiodendron maius (strain Zn) TaxID=913774 RepID=A0A0C3GU58_OIDMZ|nr:hypothetical protein OIDMADRAFT_61188 [Oidiodendron maius Zn]
MVYIVSTQVEVKRSPGQVRSAFLDFDRFSEWHGEFALRRLRVDKPDIEPGDIIEFRIQSDHISVSPVVLVNTRDEFGWESSFHGIGRGRHYFRFQSSKKTPISTVVEHWEEFSGLNELAFRLAPSLGTKVRKQFETFNNDLKMRVESLWPENTQLF